MSSSNRFPIGDATLRSHVANQYGWKISSTDTMGNMMRMNTSGGTFAVKQTHITPQNIEFLNDALDFAQQNGFTRFAPFALTKTNKSYFRKDGKTYYATSWLEGTAVNFGSLAHVGQTAYTLAEFHETTTGFKTKGFQPQTIFDLAHITAERNRDLRQMIQSVQSKAAPNELDSLLISLKSALQDDAAESLRILQSPECKSFLAANEQNPGLCHLDVIPSNFIYRPNHHVYILDPDLAAFAPRALDIAHLLRRSMEQLNWLPDIAYTCFLHFNAVKTMPKAEYTIIYALLKFPYRAWRIAHTHYRFFTDESQIYELKEYEEQERKRQAFLTEFTKQIDDLGAST